MTYGILPFVGLCGALSSIGMCRSGNDSLSKLNETGRIWCPSNRESLRGAASLGQEAFHAKEGLCRLMSAHCWRRSLPAISTLCNACTLATASVCGVIFYQLERDSGWTEEIVQDVFLAAWRSAGSYRGEAQLGTWLFRIAHNLAANARRGRRRHPLGRPFPGDEDADDTASEPIIMYDSHEQAILNRLELREALDQLSSRHREVLDLAFYQGFGSAEIALILDIPEGTVRSRISYARKALSAYLRQIEAIKETSS